MQTVPAYLRGTLVFAMFYSHMLNALVSKPSVLIEREKNYANRAVCHELRETFHAKTFVLERVEF